MALTTAAAAIAIVIVESRNMSRMIASLLSRVLLLQRILVNRSALQIPYAVPGCRIRTSSLGEGALFHAPSTQQPRQAIVSFDAARLVINPVRLVALFGEFLLDRPRPRPHGRVFDRDDVVERRR